MSGSAVPRHRAASRWWGTFSRWHRVWVHWSGRPDFGEVIAQFAGPTSTPVRTPVRLSTPRYLPAPRRITVIPRHPTSTTGEYANHPSRPGCAPRVLETGISPAPRGALTGPHPGLPHRQPVRVQGNPAGPTHPAPRVGVGPAGSAPPATHHQDPSRSGRHTAYHPSGTVALSVRSTRTDPLARPEAT